MSRGLCDDQPRRQPTRHRLGNADDVMPAGPRIAGCSVVIVGSCATEIQLRELGAIGVPLKHHHLRPVVPDGGRQDDVLVDEYVARGSRALSDRQPMVAELAIFATERVRKIDRTLIVERFMDGKAAWIGMMASEITTRSGREAERQMRTLGTFERERREHASLESTGDRRSISGIDKPL